VASLLTMAAVARRVPEFGGLAGVGLGFAGVAIIDKIAPQLSATVPSASGAFGTPQTGHGKTTLLQLLGGLDRPTRGRISFAGQDLATAPESGVRKVRASSFGFIFQTFNLVPTLTAHENVEAALIPLGVHHLQWRERVTAALDSVGLADRAQHLPGELSRGRLSIRQDTRA
jgi:putative ABC transport system ATP-binding protein